jgi:hypothetical protein
MKDWLLWTFRIIGLLCVSGFACLFFGCMTLIVNSIYGKESVVYGHEKPLITIGIISAVVFLILSIIYDRLG